MSLQRSILSPVTTAGGLYPALHTLIIQTTMPNMVAKQFYQQYSLTAGNSISFAKQAGDAGAVINQVAEGAEAPFDITAYTYANVVPYKIMHGFLITRETIEDSLLPVQSDQLVRISLRTANKIDRDCLDTIVNGSGSNVTASGTSLFFQGAETVVSGSGSIGQYDLDAAIQNIEESQYEPDTLAVHPFTKRYLMRLPHFTTDVYKGKQILGQVMQAGLFGAIGDLDCFVTTNLPGFASMTYRKVSEGGVGKYYPRAVVLSRGKAGNILGQYSPMGVFVERAPLTTAVKPVEERDSIGVFVRTRYAPVVLKGQTISVINTMVS